MANAQHVSRSHERFVRPDRQKREAPPAQSQAQPIERSLEFQKTGAEIPLAVYKTVVWAFAWIVAIAWFAFGHGVEAEWLATVGVIIGIVFFGIPILLRRTNHALGQTKPRDLDEFLHSSFETATGRLPGWEAYLQVIIIPLCLALAAAAFALIWLWVS